jgi:membrane fusion protein (multidrug efflux system)
MIPTDSSEPANKATVLQSQKTATADGEPTNRAALPQSQKSSSAQTAAQGTTPGTVTISRGTKHLSRWLIPGITVLLALLVLLLISTQWNWWVGWGSSQNTDDAYVRADVTPLSTKVAGLVAQVMVNDYQRVKAGDLIARLQDDDYKAQVEQAKASVLAGTEAIENNHRQKQLQDARIAQAETGISAATAGIAAANAGIEAAQSQIRNAEAGVAASQADVQRSQLEARRQEALIATESTTRQKLEQVVADEQRFHAQLASRQAEVSAANAQLASRGADLKKAEAQLSHNEAELEAQRRQRAVLDSQEKLLHADLAARQASLKVAETNLNYTRIVAPEDGVIGERKVRPGQLVSPGTQVVALVQTMPWVQANYKETQLTNMRPGDAAEVRVDAFPGRVLRGKVVEISPASGSQFALLPPDNATGNYTKVVQRVPVKIVFDPGQELLERLRPGLSVLATVKTNSK